KAEQSLLSARLAYVAVKSQLFQSYANLYKAVGGCWNARVDPLAAKLEGPNEHRSCPPPIPRVPRSEPAPFRTGTLAEGKVEGLRARIEKLDGELAIGNRLRLPDQLVSPLLGHGAVAELIDIGAVRGSRRLAIDEHA